MNSSLELIDRRPTSLECCTALAATVATAGHAACARIVDFFSHAVVVRPMKISELEQISVVHEC